MSHDRYIQKLNDLFARHDFGINVTAKDFLFLDKVVTDKQSENCSVSSQLSSFISPPIYNGEFFHYTGRDATDAILDSRTLRLTSVAKRINEEEIEGFLREFGFTYPLSTDPITSKTKYRESIAREIFYTSFTDTTLNQDEEQYFWDHFAGKDGARLKFRINLQSGCLRRMVYGEDIKRWTGFFSELTKLTQTELGKVFFWSDSATVCALHLPHCYCNERETRLITRRGCGLHLGNDGDIEYLELKFGLNEAIKVHLDLIEIQTNQPVPNDFREIVRPRA